MCKICFYSFQSLFTGVMLHVSRFRLYPSRGVETKLFSSFDKCCSVYNYCLENKAFKDNVLPQLKQEHPELYDVHSIVLQNVVHQLQSNLHVPFCRVVVPRDYNAALNIKHRGLEMVGWDTAEPSFPNYVGKSSTLAEIKISTLVREREQVLVEEARISRL